MSKAGTSLCLLLTGLFFWSSTGFALGQAALAPIEQRITEALLAPAVDDARIAELLKTQGEDGTWPGIDYADTSNTGFEHRYHLAHLLDLARAYRTAGSRYHEDPGLLPAINLGLRHWVTADYICQNWWHNQINTPNRLVSLMLLLGDQLAPELVQQAQPIIRRAHLDAPGARPGGDRIKIAGIQAKNALFLEDEATFTATLKVIEGEIKFSEWVGAAYGYGFRDIPSGFENRQMGGRGIQHDYSFHHRVDGVNNTLSYGLSYAGAFVEWARYTDGTDWAFSQEKLALLIDYYLDGICKTAVYGKYPDPGAKNRSISRKGTLRPYGAGLAQELLQVSTHRQAELKEIVAIREAGAKPTRAHATYFWHSEHFAFQRPDWFASVRLYSTRTHNMEVPYNSEGLLNHHRGDGVNHLAVRGDEYFDLWPVYDYQKIPGATIVQKPTLPEPEAIQQLGLTDFVGAATDGRYGAVGFDFRSPHDPLIARKAWFFFDEQYACLGAGISAKTPERSVATTLNQCHLRGEVQLSTGEALATPPAAEGAYEQVDWVYHDEVGYVFPEPATVRLQTGPVTGSWRRINEQTDSPQEPVTLDVFKLWLDHGTRPSEARYQYLVYPATTPEALAAKAARPDLTILANEPALQAVYHEGLQMGQAVFYQAGTVQGSDSLQLHSAQPGIVIWQQQPEGGYRLTVSDPNRELSHFHLAVDAKVEASGEGFVAWWNEAAQRSELLIALPSGQMAGSSVTVEW